jgi:hypothetical protein
MIGPEDGQENGQFLIAGSLSAGRPVVLRCGIGPRTRPGRTPSTGYSEIELAW